MRKTIAALLAFCVLFSLFSVFALADDNPQSEYRRVNLTETSVMDDLEAVEEAQAEEEDGFRLSDYPAVPGERSVKFLALTEDFRMDDYGQRSYGLYLYVYNPGQLFFEINSPTPHVLSMAVEGYDGGHFHNYPLTVVSFSEDRLFCKFAVDNVSDFVSSLSSSSRLYEIAGIQVSAMYDGEVFSTVDHAVVPGADGLRCIIVQYSGIGTENTSTTCDAVYGGDVLHLDVNLAYYRVSNGSNLNTYKQLMTAYFMLPKQYYNDNELQLRYINYDCKCDPDAVVLVNNGLPDYYLYTLPIPSSDPAYVNPSDVLPVIEEKDTPEPIYSPGGKAPPSIYLPSIPAFGGGSIHLTESSLLERYLFFRHKSFAIDKTASFSSFSLRNFYFDFNSERPLTDPTSSFLPFSTYISTHRVFYTGEMPDLHAYQSTSHFRITNHNYYFQKVDVVTPSSMGSTPSSVDLVGLLCSGVPFPTLDYVDIGQNFDLFDPENTYNTTSYSQATSGFLGFWQRVSDFGFAKALVSVTIGDLEDDSLTNLNPFQFVDSSDLSSFSDLDLQKKYKISSKCWDDIRSYYNEYPNKEDYRLCLFRFDISDYKILMDNLSSAFCDVYIQIENDFGVKPGWKLDGSQGHEFPNLYQMPIYKDFDVLDLTFDTPDGLVIVPVNANPIKLWVAPIETREELMPFVSGPSGGFRWWPLLLAGVVFVAGIYLIFHLPKASGRFTDAVSEDGQALAIYLEKKRRKHQKRKKPDRWGRKRD